MRGRLRLACVIALLGMVAEVGAQTCNGTTTICIAQSSSGSANGTTGNPRALSFLTTAGNWGGGGTEIDAGDTVYLSGSITSAITIPASGASGNRTWIDGTFATLGTSVGFFTNSQDFLGFNAMTWVNGANTALFNVGGSGVSNDILIQNSFADDINDTCLYVQQDDGAAPTNVTFLNNYCRTDDTDYGNTQHDIVVISGVDGLIIEGSYFEMRAGGSGANAHDDIVQSFKAGCGGCNNFPTNITLRYNLFVLNTVATNDRSWTVLEDLAGNNYVISNVFLGLDGAEGANGLCCGPFQSGAVLNVYGNTFVPKNGSAQNVLNFSGTGTINLRGNLFRLSGQTALTGSMTRNRSYNLWFGSGSPSCTGTGEVCSQDPLFTDESGNDFSLQSGSPAKDAGFNFGSPYDTGLASGATWPGPTTTSRSGTWEIGAFEFGTAPPPSTPARFRWRAGGP